MNAERQTAEQALLDAVRQAARQEQFLEVVSAEEARARFARHIDRSPLPGESVALGSALGRVLANDVVAAVDAPPFDRSRSSFSRCSSLPLATSSPRGLGGTGPKSR